MTSRQINDWDTRDALPHERSSKRGWRTFSKEDVFAILVQKTIRENFGVPLGKLSGVREFLLDPNRCCFEAAFTIVNRGLACWFMTNLTDGFVITDDVDLDVDIANGLLRTDKSRGFLLVGLNGPVNMMLESKGLPGRELDRDVYGLLVSAINAPSLTEDELI